MNNNMIYDYNKERWEALQAGQLARVSLEHALAALDSARNWGILDIFGGGFISTLIKHSKMDTATEYIEQAKTDLLRFGRELGDIREYSHINLTTGDFWGFADWFFDGFLSDWIVQSRINDARMQVQQAIRRVDAILDRLSY